VCFRVEDVDAEERRLRDAGVTIIADQDPAPGWKRFYIRDPGGNRVEIAQAVLS
jgi:predicted enzyme related to lactoylglutathione lyase